VKTIKFFKAAMLAFLGTIFLNSCGIGSYPPENEGAMITPDGKKIVQIYSIFFCTQYRSKGNFEQRSGSKTFYADIYDADNAKKINTKSFKFNNNAKLFAVTNKSFFVYYLSFEKKRACIEIYDIETGKLRFGDDQLKKQNNDLVFQYSQVNANLTGKSGIVIKADDARIYFLDDISGKATLLEDQKNTNQLNNSNFELTTFFFSDSLKFEFEGDTRKKVILKRNTTNSAISSNSDFIDPNLIEQVVEKINSIQKNKLYYAEKDWLILSKTKDNQDYEWIFSALDHETLKEKWSATLKNPLVEKKLEEIEQLYQSGNTLIIIGSQSINKLDLKSGKWLWNIRLTNEIY